MANESALRSRVGGWLREAGFFVQPIETGAIVEGVPDLFYTGHSIPLGPGCMEKMAIKCAGWLELKKIKEMPKRPTTAIFKSLNHPLSNSQANWITMCREHGTPVNIFVQYEREYFLVPGSLADEFNELTEHNLRGFVSSKQHLIDMLRKNYR